MQPLPDRFDRASGHAIDRRSNPDRRAAWRGGRRDSDWLERPFSAPLPQATPATESARTRWRPATWAARWFHPVSS